MGFVVCATVAIGQSRPTPFSEARRAVASSEQEAVLKDSLRKAYKGKWTLDFAYGQRFILSSNKSSVEDTITFADFTKFRSFFGAGFGYFLKDNLHLGFNFNFGLLPREQEINSLTIGGTNGISVEGQGNGGALLNFNLGAKYYFNAKRYTRPYVGMELGTMRLLAKGGSVNFSFNSGREDNIDELRASLGVAQLLLGITHRAAPGFMLDFNVGYTGTSKGDPVGGITSANGVTTSISLQFILNPRKE